jgi:hypothetical protein
MAAAKKSAQNGGAEKSRVCCFKSLVLPKKIPPPTM